jgi:hypothetical protein
LVVRSQLLFIFINHVQQWNYDLTMPSPEPAVDDGGHLEHCGDDKCKKLLGVVD